MGGNALSVTSVRLNKEDYERVASECLGKLRSEFLGKRIEALGSYHAKASFGDCDILIESGPDYDPNQAAAALNPIEIVRNGPVTSVGVMVNPDARSTEGNVFQVDLIKTDPQAFDFAMGYFGHGDTGNLLGRIAHAQGVSLRHDGLFYYMRDGDHKFREIELTRNFSKALAFMGYSPDGLDQGFETPEDIYSFVASSPFFSSDIFLLENRNAKARMRDKKRKMYMEFLLWCEARPDLPVFHYPKNKAEWLPRIAKLFPQFQPEYDHAVADLAEQRLVKEKFNGRWVSELTGLQGKDLGALMKRFKESFESPDAQRAFVIQNSQEALEVRVREVEADMWAVDSDVDLDLRGQTSRNRH